MTYAEKLAKKLRLIKEVMKTFPNFDRTQAESYVNKMQSIATKFNNEVASLSKFTVSYNPDLSIDGPCKAAPCASVEAKETITQDINMRFYDDCDDEDYEMTETKSYLASRLYNIRDQKTGDLQKAFGLCDDETPNTVNDLVARIKDGKFIMSKGYDGTEIIYDPIRCIKWRDPSVKEDKAGYAKARKALDVVYQDALDTVTVVTDEQARLKALKDFETVTIQ